MELSSGPDLRPREVEVAGRRGLGLDAQLERTAGRRQSVADGHSDVGVAGLSSQRRDGYGTIAAGATKDDASVLHQRRVRLSAGKRQTRGRRFGVADGEGYCLSLSANSDDTVDKG